MARAPFSDTVVDKSLDNMLLFHSLGKRLERSGVIESNDEDVIVMEAEKLVLEDYGLDHSDLEDNVFRWVVLNKQLKLFPLTVMGFAKFSELRKHEEKTSGLDDVVDLVEKEFPRVLVTLYSDA